MVTSLIAGLLYLLVHLQTDADIADHADPFTRVERAFEQLASCETGAGDGNRTHDIQLGKLSFYH